MHLLSNQKRIMDRFPVYEPMTVFTDILITIFGIWFGRIIYMWFTVRLMEVHFHFGNYFFLVAFTAFTGALFHAFYPEYETIRDFLWKLTMLGMVLSVFAMLMGTAYYVLPFETVQWVKWVILASMIPFIVWFYVDHDLMNAVKLYIPSTILVMVIMAYGWLGKGDIANAWILGGLLVTLCGASFTVTKIGFHQHFNHNDIFHIIQIVGMYLIYRGSMLLSNYGMK